MSGSSPDFDDRLHAARAGAEWAWSGLYHDLAPVLRGYFVTRGAHEPDDLVGETFLAMVRGLAEFDGDEAAFRSWVFTIATRRAIDEGRRRARRRTDPADDELLEHHLPRATTEAEAIDNVGTEDVLALLDVLTADQRTVLALRLVAGLTLPEIAPVVGRSVNATKALQRRGLRALERHLARCGVPPEQPGAMTRPT